VFRFPHRARGARSQALAGALFAFFKFVSVALFLSKRLSQKGFGPFLGILLNAGLPPTRSLVRHTSLPATGAFYLVSWRSYAPARHDILFYPLFLPLFCSWLFAPARGRQSANLHNFPQEVPLMMLSAFSALLFLLTRCSPFFFRLISRGSLFFVYW